MPTIKRREPETDGDERERQHLLAVFCETRLKLLEILSCERDQRRSVEDLARQLQMRQSSVSWHLGELRRAGYVDFIDVWPRRYYFVREDKLIAAAQLFFRRLNIPVVMDHK